MIILFVPKNIASLNIAKKLIANHGFVSRTKNEWINGEIRLIQIDTESVLEVPCDFDDFVLVLSTHKSKTPGKMLTAHFPGNWGIAQMGGESNTLNVAPASLLKILAKNMKNEGEKIGWPFSLEADHHGPTGISKMIFVEIGTEEAEWSDEEAGKAVARAIMQSLEEVKNNKANEVFFGVGGGHYPTKFTKIILESDLAVGHIAPKYVIDSMDEQMFKQAIEKNVEKVSRVLIEDGLNLKQKKKIEEFCTKLGLIFENV